MASVNARRHQGTKARRHKKACRRGLALLETAIVLPIILTITLGLIEYGWMFLKAEYIADAARQAARVAALPTGTAASAQSTAMGVLSVGGIAAGNVVSCTVTPDPATASAGTQIQVHIVVNYTNISLGMPLVPVPSTLTTNMYMAREGP